MVPAELAQLVLYEGPPADDPTFGDVMDECLEETRHEDEEGVDDRLEQDGLRQRRPIEVAQERQFVGDEDHLADHQRRHGRNEETGELDQVVCQDQTFCEQDEIEFKEKEDGRR